MSEAELLIMGDSFTFGHGVNGEERYGHMLGQLAKKRTLVASYNNGWAPPHYLKYFLLNTTLAPAHIVIGLCLHNDLYSDIRETVVLTSDHGTDFDIRLPFRAVSKSGTLVNAAPLANPTLEWLRNNSSFRAGFSIDSQRPDITSNSCHRSMAQGLLQTKRTP